MMSQENIELTAVLLWLGCMILWMIFTQLGNIYVKKHMKVLCLLIYGSENYRGGRFDMYDYFSISIVPTLIFIDYHARYKRTGHFKFENPTGKVSLYPGLTAKNALIIFNNHKKWFYYNAIASVVGFIFLAITTGIYLFFTS